MDRLFRISFAAPVGLAGLIACASPPDVPASAAVPNPVASVLDARTDFSGTVIVSEGDQIKFSAARGFADEAAQRPVALDDVWRWASVTKQIVAVQVLQEVEADRLTLDTKVGILLPELTGGRLGDVTIKDLLQHTSRLNNPADLELDAFNTSFDWRTFCTAAPAGPPDGTFNYNNCDYLLLGEVLRVVSGIPWDEHLKARILDPAGMTRTGVSGQPLPETVTGYASRGVPADAHNLEKFGASGAITGDVRDLVKFNHALLSGQLLSAASRDVLWAGDPKLGFQALGAWSFPARLEGCEAPVQLIERRGDIGGIQVRNLIAPQTGRSLIVFTNRGDVDFGEIWMGSGFSFDLASSAFCEMPA